MKAPHRTITLFLIGAALLGCPKQTSVPTDVPEPDVGAPQRGTVVHRWGDLDLSLYDDLAAAPAEGARLRALATRHDVDRYTTLLTTWGPPDRPVLQIEDTSAVERERGAVAAWILADGPTNVGEAEPIDGDSLVHGEPSRWTVASVLVRDWSDGPRAEDPFDLLLGVEEQLPGPWSVCRPRTQEQVAAEEPKEADVTAMAHAMDPVVLYAIDSERGVRVGLKALANDGANDGVPEPGVGPFTWAVDHLEQVPIARAEGSWWPELGYADCTEIGRLLGEGKARRPKRPLGPPA